MGRTLGRMDKELYLGERTRMIMECIWEAGGPVTILDIVDRMERKCGIIFSKSAINTLIVVLLKKEMVIIAGKYHQAYLYSPLLSQDEYRMKEIARLCRTTFNGDPLLMTQYMKRLQDT